MSESKSKKVIALSLGQILATLSTLMVSIVAARYLSYHDFATYKQTLMVYEFAMPVLTLGIPSAIFYFLPKEKGSKLALSFNSMVLLFALGILFFVLLQLGGIEFISAKLNNPDLHKTLHWFSVYAIFAFPVLVLNGVLVYFNKTIRLASFNIVSAAVPALFVVLFMIYYGSYQMPIIARIASVIVLLPVAIVFLRNTASGSIFPIKLDKSIDIIKFSIPLGFASLFDIISQQLDKGIVAFMGSSEEYALYINGAIEIPLIAIITGSLRTVILGEMSNEYSKGNKTGAIAIFRDAGEKSASLLIPAMFFFLVVSKQFITLLYTEKYMESYIIFSIYLLLLPARIVFFGTAIIAMGESKKIMIRGAVGLIANFIISVIAVHWFGYYAAAFASVIVVYFFAIPFNLQVISKGYGATVKDIIPFKKVGIISIVSFCGVMPLFFITRYWATNSPIFDLLICFLVFCLITIPLLLRFNLLYIPPKIIGLVKQIKR